MPQMPWLPNILFQKTGFDGFIQKPFSLDTLNSINKNLELPP